MSKFIDLYKINSLEVVEKLKNKLNLLKSPIDILQAQEIEELNTLKSCDADHFTKLKKYFEISSPSEDIIASMKEYDQLKEQYLNREKLVKFYESKYKSNRIQPLTDAGNIVNTLTETETLSHHSTEQSNENEFPEIQKVFLNSIITTKHIETLKSLKSLVEERKFISNIFLLKLDDGKDQILVDFYMNMFKFSISQNYSLEKTSTFFSIMYFLFNYSILGKKIMKQKSFGLFLKLIEFHSINRPPYSYQVFRRDEKDALIEFVNNTFFRNYSLFENIFKYNVNILLKSKSPKKIPLDEFPKIPVLNADYQLFEIEQGLIDILSKTIEKHTKETPTDSIKAKTEYEIYADTINEKLNVFRNTFNKATRQDGADGELQLEKETLTHKEAEKEELNDILEVKIKELQTEVREKIMIDDRVIDRKLEKKLAEITTKKK